MLSDRRCSPAADVDACLCCVQYSEWVVCNSQQVTKHWGRPQQSLYVLAKKMLAQAAVIYHQPSYCIWFRIADGGEELARFIASPVLKPR